MASHIVAEMPHCHVLTIDKIDGARRQSARDQMSDLGLPWEFVEGITQDDPSLHDDFSRSKNLLLMKRSMTAGEIAVYLGHRKIWQRIIDNHHQKALVLEDDFYVQNKAKFLINIADAYDVADCWDIVKFFDFSPKSRIHGFTKNQTHFSYYKYPSSGAVAYLISIEAARRLLLRPKIYRPIDEDLSHPWETQLRVFSVVPNPVSEQSDRLGGSLLERDRQDMRSSNRNVARSVYGNVLTVRKQLNSRMWAREMKRRMG